MPDTKLISVPLNAVKKVIDMFLDDEKKHWEENNKENGHIYLALRELELYVEGVENGS